jgi:DinB superfamily
MKRLILAVCVASWLGASLSAQELTAQDRAKAVAYLDKTRAEVLKATRGLSDAQWQFKPGPDRWSVAEVTEHIASTEDYLRDMIRDKVMSAPPRADAEDVRATDEMVMQKIPDRTNKAQAPEPLKPNNRYGSPKASLAHFKESRAQTLAFLKDTKDLRQHAADSPLGKKLDAYQWILFIAAHSERHTKQIQEVEADPNYPKK